MRRRPQKRRKGGQVCAERNWDAVDSAVRGRAWIFQCISDEPASEGAKELKENGSSLGKRDWVRSHGAGPGLERTGRKLDGGCAVFARGLAKRLRSGSGSSMEVMFREQAEEYTRNWELSQRDFELLCQLGMHLGRESRKVQIEQLQLFEKELEQEILSFEKTMPAKQRMYRSLGILGGLFLAILVF